MTKQETATERWARWCATRDPNRPLRTVREARQRAQKISAHVQAETRRRALEVAYERVTEDRRLTQAGLQFVREFVPPAVVPAGAPCIAATECRVPHGLYVNVATLQAVTFVLGRPPLWVRAIGTFWEGPPPRGAWDCDYFTVAIRVPPPNGRGRLPWGTCYYMKPPDLLSHGERQPFHNLPASTVPWADLLREGPIYLTGLPTLGLRKFVRRAIGTWVILDRPYTLPWAPLETRQGGTNDDPGVHEPSALANVQT